MRRLGFSGYCGSRLATDAGTFTGKVATTLDEFGKRDYGIETCRSLGVPPVWCAAVGDSRSDLPLVETAGFSVALNASPAARSAATIRLDTDDLTTLTPMLETWLHDSNEVAG